MLTRFVSLAVGTLCLFSVTVVKVWAQQCTQPPSGMVSWSPGDGNANDIIGNNPGTLQGRTTYVDGQVDQGFGFNGVDSFVNIPSPPAGSWNLGFTDAYTIDAWVKFDDINTYRPLFVRGTTNADDIEGGRVRLRARFPASR